jgi:hypothetical protein
MSCVQLVYVESMEATENRRQMTKWVQKCLNINYPHYCQREKNVEVDLRNSKKVLEDMAADMLVQAEQEKQYVAEKRKVKDDVCKDCDKIHFVQVEQEKQDVGEKCKDCNKIHSAPTPSCRLA